MSTPAQVSDIGVTLVVTITKDGTAQDVSTATTKELIIRTPLGVTLPKAASFATTGSDGKIQYTTLAGDLATAGLYSIQAHVVYGSVDLHTEVSTFSVKANL